MHPDHADISPNKTNRLVFLTDMNSVLSHVQTKFVCIILKKYRTIILPVVLYGCENWSMTLREERKLRVFENMVLR